MKRFIAAINFAMPFAFGVWIWLIVSGDNTDRELIALCVGAAVVLHIQYTVKVGEKADAAKRGISKLLSSNPDRAKRRPR